MFFNQKLLSSSIALVVAATAVTEAKAQAATEEVVVTGIRGSLMRAMDIKRDAKGVVDAISAEDIGKFPDTNLAESLQRIPGVSIDRANNEGSKVTVRGFGPEFNLVLLNGRQMPTSQAGGESSRSFDFGNLASEGVGGVEVYKTSNAKMPSGGVGSTINIKTARPLTNPGLKGSFGVKAVIDSTTEKGDDVTPEISGILSNTFADDMFGVGLSFSHQERDSRAEGAGIDSWIPNVDQSNFGTPLQGTNNNPDGNVWYPQNFGFNVEDIERTRDNAQLVLQWAPNENVTATLDYTYSELETESNQTGFGIWFTPGGNTNEAIVDERGTVVFVNESGGDFSSTKTISELVTENNSVGLNVDWQVTDTLNLAFDIHDSDAVSEGNGDDNGFLVLAANAIANKTYDNQPGNEIPTELIEFNAASRGIVNGEATADAYDSLFGQSNDNINESEITQFRLDGVWENADGGGLTSINFGIALTDMTYRVRSFQSGNLQAGWYGGNQDLYDNSLFERQDISGILSEFSGGAGDIDVPYYFDWQFQPVVRAAEQAFGWTFDPLIGDGAGGITADHTIEEQTDSAYLQVNLESEFNGMAITAVAGVRYEETDVSASSLERMPQTVTWQGPTEWVTDFTPGADFTDVGEDYKLWLPHLDISVDITENIVGRFSFGKSVTRSDLLSLRGTTTVRGNPQLNQRTAQSGNPGLKPYTSDAIDLSVEWYYDDASYVSAGAFRKLVELFIVSVTEQDTIGNLRDVFEGPRADQARADLTAAGDQLTVENIFAQININRGLPVDTAITQLDEDPLINWDITRPSNSEVAEFWGWEFAVQHVFGDTGFGVSANVTFVDGDLEVDNGVSGFQFVLPGLSDSANLVGFYDKNGLQARLAYNWRDEFLSGTNSADNAPQYTEEFAQLDATASYDLPMVEGLTLFVEALNITDESQRIFNRYSNQFKEANQFGARYNIGARYSF